MASANPFNILMVEDNPDDVRLTREALKDGKVYCLLNVVDNGEDALRYLRREERFSTATVPDIVLLDLNLPLKDGREVLRDIKTDKELRRIPVVVLTTSESEEDIQHAYNNHVNCYITKPVDFAQFIKVVKTIEDFWFSIVRLPG